MAALPAPGPRLYYQEPKRAWNYVLRWCEHNERIVRDLRATNREWILINYADFMKGDEEFRRLEKFVGRPLEDRRRKDLYRGKSKTYPSHEIAKSLVKWTKGISPADVIRKLEQLRGT